MELAYGGSIMKLYALAVACTLFISGCSLPGLFSSSNSSTQAGFQTKEQVEQSVRNEYSGMNIRTLRVEAKKVRDLPESLHVVDPRVNLDSDVWLVTIEGELGTSSVGGTASSSVQTIIKVIGHDGTLYAAKYG